jgi:hypothetical protein
MQVNLTSQNTKLEVERELLTELDRVFGAEPPDAIEWAFRTWREESAFFPTVADIRRLVIRFHRLRREHAELLAQQQEREQLEEGRKRGEVVGLGDILPKLREVAEKMVMPAQHRQMRQRMTVRNMPPALVLTQEQILARREKELEEIRRYEQTQEEAAT